MQDQVVITLDIRPLPVTKKRPIIFRAFDEIAPGKVLRLINDHDPKLLYYQFMVERAGQFDWNYAERGPQVWRVEIGKKARCGCSQQFFEKATEALKEDHRVIEKILDVLEQLTRRSAVPLETWEKAVNFIHTFAGRCHHLKEENILFPALAEKGVPKESDLIDVMVVEHEEGRAYARRMTKALQFAKSDPEAATPVLFRNTAEYLHLLRQHIVKEDQVLFTMADDLLSPKNQKQLLHAFEEHEAKEMGVGVRAEYLKVVEELQSYTA